MRNFYSAINFNFTKISAAGKVFPRGFFSFLWYNKDNKIKFHKGVSEMDLKFFYMPGCPYCQRAAGVIAELEQEHPEYKQIKIDKINEVLHPLEAKKYDYYYVPAFFDGQKKLYEAQPGDDAEKMHKILGEILAAAAK